MSSIARFSILLLFSFAAADVHATDWCRKSEGGLEPCGEIPGSYVQCGQFSGEPIWCYPSANTSNNKVKGSKSSSGLIITVAASAVFVGAMWYLFKTPKSPNNEGQVTLATF